MTAIADRLSRDYAVQRPTGLPFAAVREFIASAGIEGQAKWHADNVHDKHAQAHRQHLRGYVLCALHAMASLRDFERIAARSAQVHRVLSPLTLRARAAADWSELCAVVVEAAASMETENQERTVSLRYRDLPLHA